jgi:hypothetical protein
MNRGNSRMDGKTIMRLTLISGEAITVGGLIKVAGAEHQVAAIKVEGKPRIRYAVYLTGGVLGPRFGPAEIQAGGVEYFDF